MYTNISEQCKEIIARSSRTFTASFVMDEVEYANIKSVKYNLPSANNGKITIGGTSSMTAEIIMENVSIPAGKTIESYENVKMDDGTYEAIPMGKYKIQKAATKDTLTTLIAAGPLTFATSQGYFSELTYPTTTIQMLSEISEMIGIPIDTSGLEEIIVATKPEGYTHREIIGYIAGMHGTNAYETREGGIAFHWYEHSDEDIFTDKTDSPEVGNSFFAVKKLQIETGSSTITRGDGTTGIYVSNPLMTEAATDIVWSKIENFTYRPATFNVKSGTPCVEAWDSFTYDGNTVICTELSYSHDGGFQNVYKSANVDDTTSSGYKGPVAKAMERYYAELVLLKEAYINVLTVDQADMRYAQIAQLDVIEANITAAVIANLEVEFMTVGQADLRYANIGLSNIAIANIGEFLMGCGLITSATIIDGHVTGYLDSVEINANSITAGTLITDRLVFRGQEKSIVYELNNISNALQVVQSDTLNGEILTDRSITVDKIVARSITANEIAYNTITGQEILTQSITSREINVQELFAQDITATGTITGAKLYGAYAEIDGGLIGKWLIDSESISAQSTMSIERMSNSYYDLSDIVNGGIASSIYQTSGLERISLINNDNGYVHLEFMSLYEDYERPKKAYQINIAGIDRLVWSGNTADATCATTTILSYLDDGVYTPHISTDRIDVLNAYAKDLHCYNGTFATIYAKSSNYGALIIERAGSTNSVGIRFRNNNGLLGSICMSTVDGGLYRYNAAETGSYKLLDAGNYSDYVVPKSGGQFIGRLQVPMGQGGSYLDSVTTKSRASIYVYNAASASSYHPIITGVTVSGHTWNLGTIGNIVGFYSFLSSRTENGVDYCIKWETNTGLVDILGSAKVSTKIQSPRIEFGSSYSYYANADGEIYANNIVINNAKCYYIRNSKGTIVTGISMSSDDQIYVGTQGYTTNIRGSLTNVFSNLTIPNNAAYMCKNTSGTNIPCMFMGTNNALYVGYNTDYPTTIGGKYVALAAYAVSIAGMVATNNVPYYCRNSSGSDINAVFMTANNVLRFGYGATDVWIGNHGTTNRTMIYGTRIDLCANCSGTSDTYPALSLIGHTSSTTVTYLRPTSTTYSMCLGSSDYPFNTVYYKVLSQVSDRNDKKDVCDISDKYIALWDKLVIKTFRYINDDDKVRVGLIAQDVEQSAYEVGLSLEQCGFISKTWVVDENYTGYKYGLDYLGIAMITAAKLRQLVNIVNEHEKKIQELQDKITTLSAILLSIQQAHMA